jgi:hypothetical protein
MMLDILAKLNQLGALADLSAATEGDIDEMFEQETFAP